MYKYILILSIIVLSLSCTGDKDSRKLSEKELSYQLALDLSDKVPQLHPDSNRTLVTTSTFEISIADVIRIIQSYIGDRQQQMTNRTAEEIRTIINENAIKYAEKKLILLDAEKKGIAISQSEIDTVMNDQYKKWGGKENYLRSLKSRQLSYDYILGDLHDGLVVNRYFREIVKPNIQVDEEQVKDRFNNYYVTVRHILLTTGDRNVDELFQIKKKLEEIRSRALRGEDFTELAIQFSEDPNTKNRGGLLKDVAHGIMPQSFDDAAFTVPVGQVSDIFETQYGFHILKVEERKPHSDSFEKAAPIIRDQLKTEQQDKFYQQHVLSLREKADYREFLL